MILSHYVIVPCRVEEEDDRMLAIQDGGDGEEQRKKYDQGFSAAISSDNGTLDVAALANPSGSLKPEEETFPQVVELPPVKNSAEVKITDSTILSPPASTESSPYQPEQSSPYQPEQLSPYQLQQSPLYQHQQSPPYRTQQTSPYQSSSCGSLEQSQQSSSLTSPPHRVSKVMVGGVYSPPGSVPSHSPGSIAESASSPQSNMADFNPNMVSSLRLYYYYYYYCCCYCWYYCCCLLLLRYLVLLLLFTTITIAIICKQNSSIAN